MKLSLHKTSKINCKKYNLSLHSFIYELYQNKYKDTDFDLEGIINEFNFDEFGEINTTIDRHEFDNEILEWCNTCILSNPTKRVFKTIDVPVTYMKEEILSLLGGYKYLNYVPEEVKTPEEKAAEKVALNEARLARKKAREEKKAAEEKERLEKKQLKEKAKREKEKIAKFKLKEKLKREKEKLAKLKLKEKAANKSSIL